MGSGKWIACFVLLVHGAFALPSKLSLSQPLSSLTLTFPVLSPIPARVSEWQGGAEQPAGAKPQKSDLQLYGKF